MLECACVILLPLAFRKYCDYAGCANATLAAAAVVEEDNSMISGIMRGKWKMLWGVGLLASELHLNVV